jgi:heme-degrading monooxygenase HmoA
MISRQWRGLAKPGSAEAYVEHLRSETFPAVQRLPGFVSASILRRAVPQGVEFLVVTRWASIESIRAFAGSNAETAVVPEKVREMMVEYDHTVRHYEIVE